MSSITVYTAISGGKDHLIHDQYKGDAKFVAFLDQPQASKTWEYRKLFDKFNDNRRNSRAPKMLAHQYVDSEYSIYIDGNIRLRVPPETLVEKYLKNHDLAVFRHPQRDCLYEEATVCALRGLDDPEVIIEQVKSYEDSGFAKHKGLNECGIILRRHTDKAREFNDAWWSEYCRHSKRDQISFMYAVDKVGLRINSIPDYFIETGPTTAIKQSGDFEIITHVKVTTADQ
jgi:hypothetical protein